MSEKGQMGFAARRLSMERDKAICIMVTLDSIKYS